MPNWNQIIERFAARKPNPKEGGRVKWSATPSDGMHGYGTVVRAFCEGTTLYSYGYHFILAEYLGQDSEGRHVFLKNGDRNSPTTNKMVAETQRACYGPTVSMSALQAAGIAHGLTLSDLVDWRPDLRQYLYRDLRTGRFYTDWDYEAKEGIHPWQKPKQGQWIPYSDVTETCERGVWHLLGAVLIRDGRGDHYLCSLDEGRYFVSKLAGPVATVEEAFASLKPDPVREAETAGLAVARQGEWFFVPTGLDDAGLAKELGISRTKLGSLAKPEGLPRDRSDSNIHAVRQILTPDGRRYAKGKVFHRPPDGQGLTREHKTVNLGDHWHLAYPNTQQAAWSMGGNFD